MCFLPFPILCVALDTGTHNLMRHKVYLRLSQFVSSSVIKHRDQRQRGEERMYSAYTCISSSLSEAVWAETQTKAGVDVELLSGLLSLTSYTTKDHQPRDDTACSELALPHELSMKQMPQLHWLLGKPWCIFFIRVPSFQITLACIRLT